MLTDERGSVCPTSSRVGPLLHWNTYMHSVTYVQITATFVEIKNQNNMTQTSSIHIINPPLQKNSEPQLNKTSHYLNKNSTEKHYKPGRWSLSDKGAKVMQWHVQGVMGWEFVQGVVGVRLLGLINLLWV